MLQNNYQNIPEVYFQDNEYYYSDTHENVVDVFRGGHYTIDFRPNSKPKKRGDRKALEALKAKYSTYSQTLS
jgi:hypothetical protein